MKCFTAASNGLHVQLVPALKLVKQQLLHHTCTDVFGSPVDAEYVHLPLEEVCVCVLVMDYLQAEAGNALRLTVPCNSSQNALHVLNMHLARTAQQHTCGQDLAWKVAVAGGLHVLQNLLRPKPSIVCAAPCWLQH